MGYHDKQTAHVSRTSQVHHTSLRTEPLVEPPRPPSIRDTHSCHSLTKTGFFAHGSVSRRTLTPSLPPSPSSPEPGLKGEPGKAENEAAGEEGAVPPPASAEGCTIAVVLHLSRLFPGLRVAPEEVAALPQASEALLKTSLVSAGTFSSPTPLAASSGRNTTSLHWHASKRNSQCKKSIQIRKKGAIDLRLKGVGESSVEVTSFQYHTCVLETPASSGGMPKLSFPPGAVLWVACTEFVLPIVEAAVASERESLPKIAEFIEISLVNSTILGPPLPCRAVICTRLASRILLLLTKLTPVIQKHVHVGLPIYVMNFQASGQSSDNSAFLAGLKPSRFYMYTDPSSTCIQVAKVDLNEHPPVQSV